MHDFGKLVYLDLHKTGSTLVSKFLTCACILPLVREEKHEPIKGRPRRGTFYFVTIRHPLRQYSSLFRYGLDRKGGLFERLSSRGLANLYTRENGAFNRWLMFMLDFENARHMGEGFERVPESYKLGFLSYRYLMLTLPRAKKTILRKSVHLDIVEYHNEMNFVDLIIRNEELTDGLKRLATEIRPEFFDQCKVREFFSEDRRTNVATIKADSIGEVAEDVLKLISVKERVLLKLYA